jgi:hypothetical protein
MTEETKLNGYVRSYDRTWARCASNAELEALVRDGPTARHAAVDWRAVALELVRRLEVAMLEAGHYASEYEH